MAIALPFDLIPELPRRNGLYLWVTWLTPYLVGNAHCSWAGWVRARYTGYKARTLDPQLVAWRAGHEALLNELAEERMQLGEQTFLEDQNKFRLRLPEGAVIEGKPDLVAIAPGGETVIYDAKTGSEQDQHLAQIKLYMLLLPAAHPAYRGRSISGCLAYQSGKRVHVAPDEINDQFKLQVRRVVNQLLATSAPPRRPSSAECRFCDIAACPERMDGEIEPVVAEPPF